MALDLAVKAKDLTYPNPLVGAVIVSQNSEIIGYGFHSGYGKPHAEIEALSSVINQSKLFGAILFVNLEPCCHFGKTPPCVDKIIESGIKKVVIANIDPNPKVAGKGVLKLKQNGIGVEIGILEEDAAKINEFFFKLFQSK